LTLVRVGRVRHTVGKLSRRDTSLLQTSSRSEVEARSYECPKSWESKPGQFQDSPGTKGHLDVAPVEWRRVYYMGEGGGFPRVRAVMNQMSSKLPMACPSTKGVPECELTNLLVGLMQVRVSE
jgi:hypothetical protein